MLTSRRAAGRAHLALLLDGLLPGPPLLSALLLVAGLRGDARQVRVVDPGHSLRLPGSEASVGQHIQGDARLTGHADGLRLWCAGGQGRGGGREGSKGRVDVDAVGWGLKKQTACPTVKAHFSITRRRLWCCWTGVQPPPFTPSATISTAQEDASADGRDESFPTASGSSSRKL